MQEVKFSCTALKGSNAKGILPPDADGYYDFPVGGLNCFNSVGQYYPYETARHLFEQSAAFMRRVKGGTLMGELGHPKRLPGQSDDSFVQRVMSIDERNICVHFAEVWLDFNSQTDDQGRPIVAVMAKLKPTGAMADALERSINNPKQDTCFSVRAFTDDQRRMGIVQRNLVEIVTWDHVTEPGIATARKFRAPALETMVDMTLTKGTLERAATVPQGQGFALESAAATADALFRKLGWDLSHLNTPKFMDWK
jgi:hypothetical protein